MSATIAPFPLLLRETDWNKLRRWAEEMSREASPRRTNFSLDPISGKNSD